MDSRFPTEDTELSEDEGNEPDSHQTGENESSRVEQGTRKSPRIGKQTEFYGQPISH